MEEKSRIEDGPKQARVIDDFDNETMDNLISFKAKSQIRVDKKLVQPFKPPDVSHTLPYIDYNQAARMNNQFEVLETPDDGRLCYSSNAYILNESSMPIQTEAALITTSEMHMRSSYEVMKGVSNPMKLGQEKTLKDYVNITEAPSFPYSRSYLPSDLTLSSFGQGTIGANPVQHFMTSLSLTPALIEHPVERSDF
jgi:cell division protein FtsI/penicillin-binding protein 2